MTSEIKSLPMWKWSMFLKCCYFQPLMRNNWRWELTKLTPPVRGSWEGHCGALCQPTWWPRTLRKRSFPDNSRKCTVRIPGTVSQKSTIWHIWHIWHTWLLEGPAHRAVGMRLIIFTFVTVRKQLWGLLICRYLEVLSYAHFQRRPQKERREGGEPLSENEASQISHNVDRRIRVGGSEFVFSKK